MFKKICVNCNQEFDSYLSQNRKLCSNKCRYEWQRGRKRISKRIGWNLPMMNNLRKDKKFEEIYGDEKAKEIKEKQSKSHLGKSSGIKGKHHTKETIVKMRIAKLGKKQSESLKEKKLNTIKKFYEHTKMEILCPVCNKKIIISRIRKKKRVFCSTKCARAKQITPRQDTSIELKAQKLLTQLHIEYIAHKYISDIEHKYCCDIFIPVQDWITQKTVLELDGDYFHANPEFYEDKELNKKQKGQRERDVARNKELKEKGYRVIRLWDNEINKMDLNDFELKLKSALVIKLETEQKKL